MGITNLGLHVLKEFASVPIGVFPVKNTTWIRPRIQNNTMKFFKPPQFGWIAGSLAVLVFMSAATTGRANVYATDIKLNGSVTNMTNGVGKPLSISFILNEPATLGTTINILSTNAPVAIDIPYGSPGTLQGANTFIWDGNGNGGSNMSPGTYSITITAASSGYTNWTQTSIDTNAGMYVNYPKCIAVDNNTNSRYYGRVMVGNAQSGPNSSTVPGDMDGILKLNADGSFADEGAFGYGGYTTNDAGGTATGAMSSGGGYNPWRLRIGDDDRLYMLDYSGEGAVIAFDMQVTTNQLVINESGYIDNPYYDSLSAGLGNFDITFTTTTNAAVWLCTDDPIDFGLWYWHMSNGVANPHDTVGTWAVQAGPASDLSYPQGSLVGSGGCMVDTNLDIFISQYHQNVSSAYSTMLYTNWDHGSLWPASPTSDQYGTQTGQVRWGAGSNDATFEGVQDTIINNRKHPTLVALPMLAGGDDYPGIRVLNAANGSVVTVTNASGAVIQALTNLDYPNQYTCAAWDNVGNLYGATTSLQLWRAFSPPGTNQATTAALATLQLIPVPQIVQVSNQFVAIGGGIVFTNHVSGLNGPFTFSVDHGSHGTISTNGIFRWMPSCPDGSTSNNITIWATDSATPPQSNSMTFAVVVSECVEITVGTNAVEAGNSTCVPVNLFTTVNLTNFNFTLADLAGRFTNWDITPSNSIIASATAQMVDPYHTLFNVGVQNGQILQGSTLIGSICLQAVPNPASAFVTLAPTNMGAAAANNSPVTHFIGQNGRVVVIGGQSLLEGYIDSNSNRVLTLFGNSGIAYQLLTTSNLLDSNSWKAAGSFTLSNLFLSTNVGRTNPMQYYRAVQISP
jgi:hypothetical protein